MPNDIANNMADTINQLDEQIKELEAKHWGECRQIAHYDDEIKRLEATDVQPVRHGRWICTNDYETLAYGTLYYNRCSACGEESLETGDFCPNCGARMDGDTD